MKLAILTSSRADYGIYYPLLKKLYNDKFFYPEIIAFGTHLSNKHGYTLNQIIKDGFKVSYSIKTISKGDTPYDINNSITKTIKKFNTIWNNTKYDLIIVLGDRYEMFAAALSAIPFNLPIAHIHGGEETKGAIDNVFRHSISIMANIHFTATELYKEKVIKLKGSKKNVFNVGALSIDNLKNMIFLSIEEFKTLYNIDLSKPSILFTFHPETVSFEKNILYIDEIIAALSELTNKYQIIITMPNADTMGNMIRKKLQNFVKANANVYKVESFGSQGYLSCMKYCTFMLGNTSSGFIEASFFPKKVINLGERQKGRMVTPNIINTKINKNDILAAVEKVEHLNLNELDNINIYGNGNTADKIIEKLKILFQ
ncbi:MAG TPA: UDP-N-acetylglucosamine 2-epimerase [Bacteroidales bacterium]|nr:UDP-N-acetylglucosamine 2-epimerase [Bacteroidales bacterium]